MMTVFKNGTMVLQCSMCPKGVDGMENNVGPDQTVSDLGFALF